MQKDCDMYTAIIVLPAGTLLLLKYMVLISETDLLNLSPQNCIQQAGLDYPKTLFFNTFLLHFFNTKHSLHTLKVSLKCFTVTA